jgi:V-type H+-transporting ATPase subunit E
LINKNRLRVLGARQEVLDKLFAESRSALSKVTADKQNYKKLLKNLILQSLYTLMEPVVLVQAREEDYPAVEEAIAEAKKEFQTTIKKDIECTIDKTTPLPKDRYYIHSC